MKILVISDAWHPQVNGVVRTYEHLGEELQKRGHDVHVIGPADFRFCVPMPGYGEIKLALFAYKALTQKINAHAPDVIHIATEGPLGVAARKYCRKHDIPFTTSYHTQFPDYLAKRAAKIMPFLYKPVHALTKSYVRWFHAPASTLMVATPSLKQELKNWGFQNVMRPLSRGVHLDLFYPGEKTLFRELQGPIALYVGRVAVEKNIEKFLDMEWHGTKVVVGDGPSFTELSSRYPEAVFAGIKTGEDLAAHYRSADLFVFPSRTDTFGIVLIEALASGLPVAAYTVTGPKDIITEPFLGSLHPDNLGLAARHALKSGTPEERAAHVKAYYTWENAARQFEDAMTD